MQHKMEPAPGCNAFEPYTNLLVKQTTRGFIQEMMGCEALTEFRINTKTPDGKKVKDVMYALEDSGCIMRRLCPMLHAWTMNVWTGNEASGKSVVSYERPCRAPMGPMKCCLSQEVSVKDANGDSLGRIVEDFYYCVPRFLINGKDDKPQYILSQPTCWGGMCINVFAEKGGLCFRVPFYIFEPGKEHVVGEQSGKIVKKFSGGKELYTDADNFKLKFPVHELNGNKALLLGSVFLINQLMFESDHKRMRGYR